MKTYTLKNLSDAKRAELLKRPSISFEQVRVAAQNILDRVKSEGDQALFGFTKQFDGVELESLQIDSELITAAEKTVDREFLQALKTAAKNIEQFHRSQLVQEQPVETMPGVTCFREPRAINNVGLYVPGGTAILPSTLLMLAVPARLAGCKRIVLCTPPRKDGFIAAEILVTAKVAGVEELYAVGGAQAIAAMAYGTESIPKVDKIFGPGNQYVTAAKMIVSSDNSGTAIDMPAGPSELLVIADDQANPGFVAADLLSQAEHGVDSQVVLVTSSQALASSVQAEVQQQVEELPRREIAKQALEKSFILITASAEESIAFSNDYAPEHLILNIEKTKELIPLITCAGSVFLGPYSTESIGDYASGTNHTLPTYGFARNYSGVSIDSFLKKITFQEVTRDGLKNIGPTVEILAEAEQLQAHKNAVSIRLKTL